jgi:hypothetical protein
MGGWTAALPAAGVQPSVSGQRVHTRLWTEEACWRAIRGVARDHDEIPTVLAYDPLAADRTDLPSPATLRNRIGRRSAITARLAAERELASLHQIGLP